MGHRIAVVGAGIIGRILSWKLLRKGHEVTLFDREEWHNPHGCSYAAAGMVAPYCEMDTAEYLIARIGLDCYYAWKDLVKEIDPDLFFVDRGSLVVAHVNHQAELDHLKHRIARHPLVEQTGDVDAARIAELEPELAGRFQRGLFYPLEAALDNRAVLKALERRLTEGGVHARMRTPVLDVAPGQLTTADGVERYDWVVDTRGLAARSDLTDLRGVRGELVVVETKDVRLTRPIRLLHPRYPVYIVPHGGDIYFVGATAIESEDDSAITVRTTLELLSAAYIVHPGFAEARVVETVTNLRPAYFDNIPRIRTDDRGLLRVNGLYRHGFLMSPRVADEAVYYIEHRAARDAYREIFEPLAPGSLDAPK